MGEIKFKRRFTEEQRTKFVNEVLESGSNILIAKKYDIHEKLLNRWVTNFNGYRKVTRSNQLWQMDIKYCFIAGTRKTAYITSIIDIFDRCIVSQSIDLSATGVIAKSVLLKGLYCRGIKDCPNGLIIRTDNGSQFISGIFEEACLKEQVIHERIPVRSPNYNAYIESFHRYLQDECLTGKKYMSLENVRTDVTDYVYRYNHERIHSSIDYYSPYDYYIKNIS